MGKTMNERSILRRTPAVLPKIRLSWLIVLFLVSLAYFVRSAASIDSQLSISHTDDRGKQSPELVHNEDSTPTESLVAITIGVDTRFPYWIVGTAFPW